MPMSKANKAVVKDQFAERLKRANAAIVAEYRGLTVSELTDLRVKLRAAKAEFHVVKNRVCRVGLREQVPEAEPLSATLRGPVGVVFAYGDPAAATKSLLDWEKERKEVFKVTGGYMDGKAIAPKDLQALADLPSREVLLARIIGSLVSPHRGLLTVLQGVPRNVVNVINAIKDKKAN